MAASYARRAYRAVKSELPGLEPALLRLYTLLALTRGEDTTREDVHDAWSLWRMATNPNHRSIVPFEWLTPDVQALDQPYVDAIHRAARTISLDGGL